MRAAHGRGTKTTPFQYPGETGAVSTGPPESGWNGLGWPGPLQHEPEALSEGNVKGGP